MRIDILENEVFRGGHITEGINMPCKEGTEDNLHFSNGNQVCYLLLSNKGRYIYSPSPFSFRIDKGFIEITDHGEIKTGFEGSSLRSAYLYAMKNFYPTEVKTVEEELFRSPQFNTWIELTYNQNQKDILKYAEDIVNNGFTPGVLMIDDNWQEDYGVWKFHEGRFPDPEKMTDTLHKMGFKLMLWVCPFVSPDSFVFRELEKKHMLVRTPEGETFIRHWWNGWSGLLDLSNPETAEWFGSQLDFLQKKYGIEGFKFDAGSPEDYPGDCIYYEKDCGNYKAAQKFSDFACRYPFSELREICNRPEGAAAQRLSDKNHAWKGNGVDTLIPNSLCQSLMGYQFICPDMIGGGDFRSFEENSGRLDQELIVRNAQASALLPMMQFSAAPWRILSRENLEKVKKAAELHEKFADYIIETVNDSLVTRECVVRLLDYSFPGKGYENINDEFMLGDKLLVCPVQEKGREKADIILPPGKWRADTGEEYEGDSVITTDTPLDRLPYFTLL